MINSGSCDSNLVGNVVDSVNGNSVLDKRADGIAYLVGCDTDRSGGWLRAERAPDTRANLHWLVTAAVAAVIGAAVLIASVAGGRPVPLPYFNFP